MKKNLTEFLEAFKNEIVALKIGAGSKTIAGITADSKKVRKNFIFCALAGKKVHGIKFVPEAAARFASAFIIETPHSEGSIRQLSNGPLARRSAVLSANGLGGLIGALANWVYDDPSKDLPLVAITGTNGKTTITYMLESIANGAKKNVGVLGTVNYRVKGTVNSASLTTPQSDELIGYLAAMRDNRCDFCFMEATSQALDMGRLNDLKIDGAVFTNLTQDHLDYHKTMEGYFQAKSKLFLELLANSSKKNRFVAINVDDVWGSKLWRKTYSLERVQKLSFGIKNEEAMVQARQVIDNTHGISFVLKIKKESIPVSLNLLGLHNVSNALAAAASAWALGFSLKEIKHGLETLRAVPGRLEQVLEAKDFLVLVDYAHTPDALENVIRAVKNVDGVKRVITVFGCGGNRDRGKRPIMGQIAARLGDFAVITSDNPRGENPSAIVAEIEAGIKAIDQTNYKIIVDRKCAIAWAIGNAKRGDCVLLAGKGHETYQIFKDKTIHFDDREICREILSGRLLEENKGKNND